MLIVKRGDEWRIAYHHSSPHTFSQRAENQSSSPPSVGSPSRWSPHQWPLTGKFDGGTDRLLLGRSATTVRTTARALPGGRGNALAYNFQHSSMPSNS